MKSIGTKLTKTKLFTCLALAASAAAVACNQPGGLGAPAPLEEEVGQLGAEITRGTYAFNADANTINKPITQTMMQSIFAGTGGIADWSTSNSVAYNNVVSPNTSARVTFVPNTTGQGLRFGALLGWQLESTWPRDTTLWYRVKLESGWTFGGDTILGGLSGGAYYPGTGGRTLKANGGDGWATRFRVVGGQNAENNLVRADLTYADMTCFGGASTACDANVRAAAQACTISADTFYWLKVSAKMNTGTAADGKLRMWIRDAATSATCLVYSSDTFRFGNDCAGNGVLPKHFRADMYRVDGTATASTTQAALFDDLKWNNYFYDAQSSTNWVQ